MRRKMMLVIGVVLAAAAVLVAGCRQTNDFQELRRALETTDEITRGQMLTEFRHELDFEGLDLTPEESRELETYREIKGTIAERFDRRKGLSYVDGHLDVGGMGLDFKVYTDAERAILLLPTFTKFLVVHRDGPGESLAKAPVAEAGPEWAKRLAEFWNGLLKAENVRKTGSELVATPDGEVKVIVYEVVLDEAEVRDFAREGVRTVLTDPQIRERIVTAWLEFAQEDELENRDADAFLAEMLDNALAAVDRTTFEDFRYSGAVDRDRHLVRETISGRAVSRSESVTAAAGFEIKIRRWALGRPVSIEPPAITPENSFALEELEANMPKMFESVLEGVRP